MRLYNMTMRVNRLELLKANIGLEMIAGFDELQKFFDEKLTDRATGEFERLAGILGKTVQDNAKAAHAIVNASFHNATFSDRIWMYQDMLKAELSNLLQTGLIRGQNPRKLATHLRKRFGVSQSNAERLMITELARVQTEAQKQSFERNGFDEYTFLALGDACPICRALDEKHFKVKKMMPGENAPPMHPHCRCSTAAYMDSKEYNQWLDGYQQHGLSFDDWKKQKDNSVAKKSGSGIIKEKRNIHEMNLQFFAEKDIKNQSSSSLKRAIRKYQARIEEHETKINNPSEIYPDWDSFDERYQQGLKRHWNKEIRNFKQSIQDRIDELKERGDYDE